MKNIIKGCDQIRDAILAKYDCEAKFEEGLYCSYRCTSTVSHSCIKPNDPRYIIMKITFKLKCDLLPENVNNEVDKFNITRPHPTHVCGQYYIITLQPETIDSYFMWAKYRIVSYDLSNSFDVWKKYTPGDKIVGEPEVRKETMTKPSTGKIGSIITFNIRRFDMVEPPLNALQLERFLAKYCPTKLEE